MINKIYLVIGMSFLSLVLYGQDWAQLQRYQSENMELMNLEEDAHRVVFMGNSITEGWSREGLDFFDNPSYVNRGISGQTTPQMVLRFRQDVVQLNPQIVVILAGINDIAGNTGETTLTQIMDNIKTMCEIASANDILVILSSVLPAYDFPWRPGLAPAEKVVALNKMIKRYAEEKGHRYLDYFSHMVDHRNGMKEGLASDEVHPTNKGYEMMAPLAEEAINAVRKQ